MTSPSSVSVSTICSFEGTIVRYAVRNDGKACHDIHICAVDDKFHEAFRPVFAVGAWRQERAHLAEKLTGAFCVVIRNHQVDVVKFGRDALEVEQHRRAERPRDSRVVEARRDALENGDLVSASISSSLHIYWVQYSGKAGKSQTLRAVFVRVAEDSGHEKAGEKISPAGKRITVRRSGWRRSRHGRR